MAYKKKTISFEGGRYYRKAKFIHEDGILIDCYINHVKGGACQISNITKWTGQTLDVGTDQLEIEEYPRSISKHDTENKTVKK